MDEKIIVEQSPAANPVHAAYRFTWKEKLKLFKSSNIFLFFQLASLLILIFVFFNTDSNTFDVFKFNSSSEKIDVIQSSKNFLWRPLNQFAWVPATKQNKLNLPIELNNTGDENIVLKLGDVELNITQGSQAEFYRQGPNLVSVVKKGRVFSDQQSSYLQIIELPQDPDWTGDSLAKSQIVSFESKSQSDWESQKWLAQITPYKRFFQNCFIKHYTENKGQVSGGSLNVELSLSPGGNVKQVELVQNDFAHEESLTACLKEVSARIQIATGNNQKPISFSFPINFKLPDQR